VFFWAASRLGVSGSTVMAFLVMIWWVRTGKYREVNNVLFDPHQKPRPEGSLNTLRKRGISAKDDANVRRVSTECRDR
jgi:hypothetical protein